MTSKDIAEAVGKPERTVRDWVKNLAAKSAAVEAKLAASSPMKPADYSLAEVCDIIEEGLGKAAADVYRTNATQAQADSRGKPAYTASMLHELRLMVRERILSPAQVCVMIGAPDIPGAKLAGTMYMPRPRKKSYDAGLSYLKDAIYPINPTDLGMIFDVDRVTVYRIAKGLGLNTRRGVYEYTEAVSIWDAMNYGITPGAKKLLN